MESYMNQLIKISQSTDTDLMTAFKRAGVPTSTFYRTINGTTELRYDTAYKVYKAMYGKEKSTND
jgi:predicted transcriptional regulator